MRATRAKAPKPIAMRLTAAISGSPPLASRRRAGVAYFTTLRSERDAALVNVLTATRRWRVDMRVVRGLSALPRVLFVVALLCGLNFSFQAAGPIGKARAAGMESLMVPSAAMGRDIPVAFLGGGPHAVYLLDAFNAAPDVSNWVTAGNARGTLAGKGVSVVAPASGAFSMYTNWEQDGSKQWETFLSSELPNWLAANKGPAPRCHGVVGASQGGYAAMALACFHPDRFGFAGPAASLLSP